MEQFQEKPVIVNLGGTEEADELLVQLPGVSSAKVVHLEFPELPELEIQGIYGEAALEKQEWKCLIKEQVKKILKYKPEAVFAGENLICRISDRAFTSKKTHTGTDSGAKRREEADCADSVRIIRKY